MSFIGYLLMLSGNVLAGFIGAKDWNYLFLIASCLMSLVGYLLYRHNKLRVLSMLREENMFLSSIPSGIIMQSIPPLIIFSIFKLVL